MVMLVPIMPLPLPFTLKEPEGREHQVEGPEEEKKNVEKLMFLSLSCSTDGV